MVNIKKIKNIFFFVSSFLLLGAPVVTLAQSPWFQSNVSGRFGLSERNVGGSWGIIHGIMIWILGIIGFIGIIGFAISGFLYLTAAGDEDRMRTAKRAMVYSIIGVLVALSAVVIITAIDRALSAFPNARF